jgi:hypothetical protein
MTRKHNCASRIIFAGLISLPLLGACGLRGGLQRPAPIFKDVPVSEPAKPETVEPVRESIIIRERVNEFGGEIPDAAPTEEVTSAPLADPVETDNEDE